MVVLSEKGAASCETSDASRSSAAEDVPVCRCATAHARSAAIAAAVSGWPRDVVADAAAGDATVADVLSDEASVPVDVVPVDDCDPRTDPSGALEAVLDGGVAVGVVPASVPLLAGDAESVCDGSVCDDDEEAVEALGDAVDDALAGDVAGAADPLWVELFWAAELPLDAGVGADEFVVGDDETWDEDEADDWLCVDPLWAAALELDAEDDDELGGEDADAVLPDEAGAEAEDALPDEAGVDEDGFADEADDDDGE